MKMMIERRCDLEGRVPMRLPIELEHIGHAEPSEADAFEADAIDVSTGGLSMRARCLPDVGTQLACRFAVVTGGATVTAIGEVVWTRFDGPRRGEFGVRFVQLAPEQKMLVAEMLAERAARMPTQAALQTAGTGAPATQRGGGSAEDDASENASPSSGEVTLDLGHAAISGMLTSCDSSGARVEQPLDMLALGQGLWLEGEGGGRRHAHISSVSLRVEGKTPTLALQVAYDDEGQLEQEASEQVAEATPPVLCESQNTHDTTPDLTPPSWTEAAGQEEAGGATCTDQNGAIPVQQRDTMSEFALDSTSGTEAAPTGTETSRVTPEPLGEVTVQHAEEGESELVEPEPVEQVLVPRLDLSLDPEFESSPGRPDASIAFELPKFDEELSEEVQDPETPLRSRLTSAQFRAALDASPLFREGGPWLRWVAYAARLSEQLRRKFDRTGEGTRSAVASSVQGMVARVGQSAATKKRRTAGRARKVSILSQIKHRLPIAIVGLLVVAAAGLLSYALGPDKDPLLTSIEQIDGEALTTQPSGLIVAAQAAPIVPQVAGTTVTPPSVAPRIPASAPVAPIETAAGPPGAAVSRGPSFGAEKVPAAKTFTLRMTNPITKLQGIPDAGGFTVIIPGSLSRDPAGPFAAQHGSIERSMILNKDGSRAELTIRFKNGLKPPYRVEAHGAELTIQVGLP